MRVSDWARFQTFKSSLTDLQQQLGRSQEQIASGKSLLHPADDPVTAARAIQITAQQNANAQFKKTLEQLQLVYTTGESSLDTIHGQLSEAKQLAVTQSSDTMDASARLLAAEKIKGVIEQLVIIGNTKIGNTYSFGGTKSNIAPFTLNETDYSVTFNGSSQVTEVYVASNQTMDMGMSGQDIFSGSGIDVFDVLKDLKDALEANNVAAIADTLTGLDKALDLTENNISRTGVMSSRLETLLDQKSTQDTMYTELLSDITDVDIASVTADYNSLSNSYQAMIYMMSKMQQMSILNYM